MIARRPWMLALASTAVAGVASAQPRGKARRIGVLYFGTESQSLGDRHQALLRGLRELGYVEGESLALELRFADGDAQRLDRQAAELVRADVELIVATSTLTGQAAQRQTRVLPIVVTATADPVGDGFAQSLAHPGLNITGMSTSAADSIVKHIEMLVLLRPQPTRVAVLANPQTRAHAPQVDSLRAAGRTLRTPALPVYASRVQELPAIVETLARERTTALVVLNDGLFFAERRTLAAAALERRLPMTFGFREGPEAGMLFSYGPNLSALVRRSASFVDRILRGAKPADLPFEQPTTFELVLNLKTARTLGVAVPASLTVRADEVIE